jgi:putative cell wall-binding protein
VADPVLTRVRALPVVGSVVRLAGPDRASTAARVALESRSVAGAPDTAFLVAGRSWADAVAAAPVAAALSSPILLAGDAALPTATRTELLDLGIKRVVIVGGTGVVPTGIEDAVRAVPGVTAVVRIAGSDRFETAERVAAWGVGNAGLDPRTTIVAGGADFPDALAAAPLTRWTEGPLVLTRAGSVPAPVAAFLDGRGADRRLDLVVGGPAAVSEATLASLANRY